MVGRRWDGDERGEGIADALLFVPGVEELLAEMRSPAWVAEEPELHLLPHVQRSCESLPLQFVDARASEDGSFDIELGWTGQMQGIAAVRAAVYSLVGGFAEVYTYIRQRRSNAEGTGEIVTFEIVTGILGEETQLHTSRTHDSRQRHRGLLATPRPRLSGRVTPNDSGVIPEHSRSHCRGSECQSRVSGRGEPLHPPFSGLLPALIDGPLPVALCPSPATRPPARSETRSGGCGHAPRTD
jgi:hypothetical protein